MSKPTLRDLTSESGVAVVVALGVLTVLLMLTGVALSAALDSNATSNHDTRSKRAFEAAEAGLQATLYRLNMNINSSSGTAEALQKDCIGGGSEAVESPTLPSSGTKYVCLGHSESLGNSASYTSWTTTVFSGTGECAGVQVGTSANVAERCITAEGTVEPGHVRQRVQERVASFDGQPVFGHKGVTAETGITLGNTAKVEGQLYTNGQIVVQNPSPTAEAWAKTESAPKPIYEKGASEGQLGTKLPELKEWTPAGQIAPVPAESEGITPNLVYTSPDGDKRISNYFKTCGSEPCGERDTFAKNNNGATCTASACGWNAAERTLSLPSGYTWELAGGTYNLCSMTLNGTAKLALKPEGKGTVIYIDSPSDPASGCKAGTGYLQINNGAFINTAPGTCEPTPCTPLRYDTRALQIYVYGPSDVPNSTWNNNACLNGSDPTCVTIGGTGEFWGTVYAPFSDVAILNPGLTVGAIIGRTVTFNNKGTFKQDTVDQKITTTATGTYYRTAWHQCPTSQAPSNPMAGC